MNSGVRATRDGIVIVDNNRCWLQIHLWQYDRMVEIFYDLVSYSIFQIA